MSHSNTTSRRPDIGQIRSLQARYARTGDGIVADQLRATLGGICRHCGALNTGRPHSWHSHDCPRFDHEEIGTA
jgi:hypothetical protein